MSFLSSSFFTDSSQVATGSYQRKSVAAVKIAIPILRIDFDRLRTLFILPPVNLWQTALGKVPQKHCNVTSVRLAFISKVPLNLLHKLKKSSDG
jgi:hypothetical protein